MTDKQLVDKAIDIRGKQYVQVKDRLNYFNETYPNGCIQTTMVSDNDRVVFRAKVTPDVTNLERYFTGTSASNPSKSIEAQVPHEVAETSAVGRALAMMGIGVIDSVASVDEMNKVSVSHSNAPKSAVNDESGQWCDYHKCSMKMNVNNKPYHRDGNRNEGDQFCNGIGFPSEISEHKKKLALQRKQVSLPPEN